MQIKKRAECQECKGAGYIDALHSFDGTCRRCDKCSGVGTVAVPKPLTPDQKDGGAQFEARQNAGLDY